MINENIKTGIKIQGHKGTWGVIDHRYYNSKKIFLLEHDFYGDEAAALIVDENARIVLSNVWNGFDDLYEHFEN